MTRTPEQRRRERPFLCRHNLWHRWEMRRVNIFGRGLCAVWVCKRCRVAHPNVTTIHSFAQGGIVGKGQTVIIGEVGPERVEPLRRSEQP